MENNDTVKAPVVILIPRTVEAMDKEREGAAELGYKVEFHDVPDQPHMVSPLWVSPLWF